LPSIVAGEGSGEGFLDGRGGVVRPGRTGIVAGPGRTEDGAVDSLESLKVEAKALRDSVMLEPKNNGIAIFD